MPRSDHLVTRSSRPAGIAHGLLALAGWLVFGWFWYRVFYRTPADESAAGVLVVAVLLVLSVGLTLAWIRHNQALARRYRGRRTRIPEADRDWSRDVLGRPVEGPSWDVVQEAVEVEIDVDERTGRKVYRAF